MDYTNEENVKAIFKRNELSSMESMANQFSNMKIENPDRVRIKSEDFKNVKDISSENSELSNKTLKNSGCVNAKSAAPKNVNPDTLHSSRTNIPSKYPEVIKDYPINTTYAIARDFYSYMSFISEPSNKNQHWPIPDRPTFLTTELQRKLLELTTTMRKSKYRWFPLVLDLNDKCDICCLRLRTEKFTQHFFFENEVFFQNCEAESYPEIEVRDVILAELFTYCFKISFVALCCRFKGNIMAPLFAVERINQAMKRFVTYGYLDVSDEWFGILKWSGNFE